MARCPSCDYPLPEDRERMGSRCPSCKDPLYEPAGRFGRPVRMGEAACTVHPANESLGPCSRCGNFLCEICRCKYRDQVLCAACVERALESTEATPEQARIHFRQALFSLLLGIAAWVLFLVGFLGVVLLMAASGEALPNVGLILLVGLAIMAAAQVALFGVGQGAAALRMRGNHMTLATLGLIVSGLYVGAVIGLAAFSIIWNS